MTPVIGGRCTALFAGAGLCPGPSCGARFRAVGGPLRRGACSLARDHGARLVVLHVVPLPAVLYGPPSEEYLAHLREQLAHTQARDPQVSMECRLVEGEPATAILRTAEEVGCDLIVLGTHGRTGLPRLVLGSVAEQVLREASCLVLIVKTPPPGNP